MKANLMLIALMLVSSAFTLNLKQNNGCFKNFSKSCSSIKLEKSGHLTANCEAFGQFMPSKIFLGDNLKVGKNGLVTNIPKSSNFKTCKCTLNNLYKLICTGCKNDDGKIFPSIEYPLDDRVGNVYGSLLFSFSPFC